MRKPPLNTELPTAVRMPQFNVPAIVAFPAETFNPLDEVRPAEVKVPATVALPVITLRPPFDVMPLQTRPFVTSNVMPSCPAFAPVKAMVPIRGDDA